MIRKQNEKIGHNHSGYTPIANSTYSRRNLLDLVPENIQIILRKRQQNIIYLGAEEDLSKTGRALVSNDASTYTLLNGETSVFEFQVANNNK